MANTTCPFCRQKVMRELWPGGYCFRRHWSNGVECRGSFMTLKLAKITARDLPAPTQEGGAQ